MDEAGLLIQLVACLDAGIASYNAAIVKPRALPDGLIAQRGMQPRQEGAPDVPAIIVTHSGTVPRGFPRRKNVWDKTANAMKFYYEQRKESTYHIEALVPQSPATPDAMTEADVLDAARYMLQNDATIDTLKAQNVFLLRVASMSSNYIEDDKDQNENVPFFEITFVYRSQIVIATPVIDSLVINIDRV